MRATTTYCTVSGNPPRLSPTRPICVARLSRRSARVYKCIRELQESRGSGRHQGFKGQDYRAGLGVLVGTVGGQKEGKKRREKGRFHRWRVGSNTSDGL